MPQTSDIDTKELDKLQGSSGQEESGENQDDSLEQKVAKSLNYNYQYGSEEDSINTILFYKNLKK